MKIFGENANKVAVIRDQGVPGLITVEDFPTRAVLINQLGLNHQVNAQVTPSLGRSIYIYTMGNRPGQLQIGGWAFIADFCDREGEAQSEDGVSDLLMFYHQNKIASRSDPIDITLGKWSFAGYLTQFNVQIEAADGTRTFQWRMGLIVDGNREQNNGLD